jgi:hypothetical protein
MLHCDLGYGRNERVPNGLLDSPNYRTNLRDPLPSFLLRPPLRLVRTCDMINARLFRLIACESVGLGIGEGREGEMVGESGDGGEDAEG